jgi:hypothetical protein
MVSGNIPRLIEVIKKHAGEDNRLACGDAFRIAADLDISVSEVGRVCNELGVKIVACQLGCF